jgi:hypothetical protein
MCAGHEHPARGSLRSTWKNLSRGDMPLGERLRTIALNYRRRGQLRQACCGHYGDPGC